MSGKWICARCMPDPWQGHTEEALHLRDLRGLLPESLLREVDDIRVGEVVAEAYCGETFVQRLVEREIRKAGDAGPPSDRG
jgi:hypothetical protein